MYPLHWLQYTHMQLRSSGLPFGDLVFNRNNLELAELQSSLVKVSDLALGPWSAGARLAKRLEESFSARQYMEKISDSDQEICLRLEQVVINVGRPLSCNAIHVGGWTNRSQGLTNFSYEGIVGEDFVYPLSHSRSGAKSIAVHGPLEAALLIAKRSHLPMKYLSQIVEDITSFYN